MAGTAETFRAVHVSGRPLLMPNPWDALDDGTYGFLDFAAEGRQQASAALRPG